MKLEDKLKTDKASARRSKAAGCKHPDNALCGVGLAIHTERHAPDKNGVTADPRYYPVYWCSKCGAIALGSSPALEHGGKLVDKPVVPPLLRKQNIYSPSQLILPVEQQWMVPDLAVKRNRKEKL